MRYLLASTNQKQIFFSPKSHHRVIRVSERRKQASFIRA